MLCRDFFSNIFFSLGASALFGGTRVREGEDIPVPRVQRCGVAPFGQDGLGVRVDMFFFVFFLFFFMGIGNKEHVIL